MALPRNKKRNLRRILRGFGAASGTATVPGAGGKALEAWIFMRLAMAARSTGRWRVSLRQGDGTLLPLGSSFSFASSQSGIQPASLFAPCYVLLEGTLNTDNRIELHGSLQWEGRSQATHEIDVSAIPAIVADALRLTGGGLPRGLPVAAIECKDKSSTGAPDEMRETLARMFDLVLVTPPRPPIRPCRIYEPGTGSVWGQRSESYRKFFSLGTFAIARVGKFSKGTRRMGTHYYIIRAGNIYDPAGLAIAELEQSFQETLTNIDQF